MHLGLQVTCQRLRRTLNYDYLFRRGASKSGSGYACIMTIVNDGVSKRRSRRSTQRGRTAVQESGQSLPGPEGGGAAPVSGTHQPTEGAASAGCSHGGGEKEGTTFSQYAGIQDGYSLPPLRQETPWCGSLAVTEGRVTSQIDPTVPFYQDSVNLPAYGNPVQHPDLNCSIADARLGPENPYLRVNAGASTAPTAHSREPIHDMNGPQGPCVAYHPVLLNRIAVAEERVRYPPHLPEVREEFRRRLHDAVTNNDEYGRTPMHSWDVRNNRDPLGSGSLQGYPENDDDVQYMFEDALSISKKLVEDLRSALLVQVGIVRKTAKACIIEIERVLAEQAPFRPISSHEIDGRRRYIITRFLKARQGIINKYQNYASNCKLLAGSGGTTERRGSLSLEQKQLLRLWLFENFLDPYPSPVDKEKLCADTGMTKIQIDNWFINARARIWKPTASVMSGGLF